MKTLKKYLSAGLALLCLLLPGCTGGPGPAPTEVSVESLSSASSGVVEENTAMVYDTSTVTGSSQEGKETPSLTLYIDGASFSVQLQDNPAAQAFATLLPLELSMRELNGNEKYSTLPQALPADPQPVDGIRPGDLMLYGADTLVLFYEAFPTSYQYTRLGYIEDATQLAAAVGSSTVKVSFSMD